MKKLVIYGHSDDLVEVEGDLKGADEYSTLAYNSEYRGYIDLYEPERGRVRIHALYTNNGCWSFAFGLVDEEDPAASVEYLEYSITLQRYSTVLEMKVEDEAELIPCGKWNL